MNHCDTAPCTVPLLPCCLVASCGNFRVQNVKYYLCRGRDGDHYRRTLDAVPSCTEYWNTEEEEKNKRGPNRDRCLGLNCSRGIFGSERLKRRAVPVIFPICPTHQSASNAAENQYILLQYKSQASLSKYKQHNNKLYFWSIKNSINPRYRHTYPTSVVQLLEPFPSGPNPTEPTGPIPTAVVAATRPCASFLREQQSSLAHHFRWSTGQIWASASVKNLLR